MFALDYLVGLKVITIKTMSDNWYRSRHFGMFEVNTNVCFLFLWSC